MSPWWAAIPPAEGSHPCSGAVHPILWSDGLLRTPAHGDPEAEQTLGALGGDVPACIRLRQAWTVWAADPALVTLGRRPGESSLGFAVDDGLPVTGALHTPPMRRRRPQRDRRDALVALLSLPVPIVDRLVLTSMAAASEAWHDEAFREHHGLRLGAALAARARPAVERLGRQLAAPDEEVVVHVAPAVPGAPATLEARRSSAGLEVTAALPLRWLASVWGAGLSEPDGHLVTSLLVGPEEGYVAEVVTWVPAGGRSWLGETRAATLTRDERGDWRVTVTER